MRDRKLEAVCTGQIRYRGGYKYQLLEDARFYTDIPYYDIGNQFIHLFPSGLLTISKGYAWDGSTGVPDTKESMRASLVHDALLQLAHEGLISSSWKPDIDAAYHKLCLKDGMWRGRAWWRYKGVVKFGSAEPALNDNKPEYTAP